LTSAVFILYYSTFKIISVRPKTIMKIGLVVPSFRRPWMVRQFLSAIQSQSRLPDEIVLSVVDPNDIPELTLITLPIKLIYGEAGSCVQRNRGIDYLRYKVDIILFLDDDFLTGNSYIEQLECIFEADPRIVGVTGHVISDGATSRGHTVSEANRLIADYEAKRSARGGGHVKGVADAYGCNMAFRSEKIDQVRFDERLPLYGWQEDVDFSAQLRSLGLILWTDQIWGVHLGTKVGKTSGLRFGYSQVINPFYVVKKGNMSAKRAWILVLKNVSANIVKSIAPESYVDRRGRLRGNLIGLLHLATGHLNPEYILCL
jgi:glycosyltransferase involved in cell wall biosynthesis